MAADLVGSGLTLSTSTANPGGSISISGTIQNIGTTTASNFEYGVYISADTVIDPNTDLLIGGEVGLTLAAGQSYATSGTVTIPSYLSPGTYYLGVYLDDTFVVAESNENNNVLYQPITVQQPTSSGNADLTGVGLTLSADTVAPGDYIMIGGTILNTGTADANNFEYGIYISTDPIIDPATDALIGGDVGVNIAAGGSLDVSGGVLIPSTLAPGT